MAIAKESFVTARALDITVRRRLLICTLAAPLILMTPATLTYAAEQLPSDVKAFIARRAQCDHFRGEDADDAERAAFLRKKMDTYCKGSDAELKALRTKYAANEDLVKRLRRYENVE
jgi:predicted lipoprotein